MQRSSKSWPVKAFCGAAALLLAAACSQESLWDEQRRFAMGTWVDTVYATGADTQRQRIEAALDELLGRLEIDYYAWADGALGRTNSALGAGSSYAGSAELTELLARARELSARSEGFFDPGVGALVEAWGFHSAQAEPASPTTAFLDDWRRDPPSIADLQIAGPEISSPRRDLVLDLGGLAKGEVVDRMLEVFAAAGVRDVLVNAGGDVRVLGTRGERPWTIGIQSPRHPELLGSIALAHGEAAFTSGDYERYFESDAGRQHHLLDPRTGHPATHTLAITVVAENGALADAAATALFIAGPSHWRRIAAALGIEIALRVDASGAIQMTPAMRERVRMQGTEETATIP